MEKGWIDSHSHIGDAEFAPDREAVIQRAMAAGITRIMVIAGSVEQAQANQKLAADHDRLDLAVGFHPEDADTITAQDLQELEALLTGQKFAAIGEIGLDYYWRKDNKAKQQELFIRQLELANAYDRPVIIHSRDATNDTYQLLKDHPVKRHGVMHCFSGSVETALNYIKLGYYISLAGPVTFKNAVAPKEVAANIPIATLLIETDSPYMAPHPQRGKRNEPAFVRYVGEEICRLRGIETTVLIEGINDNYKRLFGI